ncbi:hypothetical protein NPIL_80081 [Nephila pilipes]|uniref:Uncharacterized protein n=1 Tax=Nephila pilipes TaxID=299642 RepID=A0A8X6Q586_NEPPI|nr:hypothetical protein NPIL_80081 [Nephila pilipes]
MRYLKIEEGQPDDQRPVPRTRLHSLVVMSGDVVQLPLLMRCQRKRKIHTGMHHTTFLLFFRLESYRRVIQAFFLSSPSLFPPE